MPVVQNPAVTILSRTDQLLRVQVSKCSRLQKFWVKKDRQNQIMGADDRNNWNDSMANFRGVFTVSTAMLSYVPKTD